MGLDTSIDKLLNVLIKMNYLDEHSVRDFRIKKMFNELRSEGMKVKDSAEKVSEAITMDGEPMGVDNVLRIIYHKK